MYTLYICNDQVHACSKQYCDVSTYTMTTMSYQIVLTMLCVVYLFQYQFLQVYMYHSSFALYAKLILNQCKTR